MNYISFLIIFLAGISGIYLGIIGFREHSNIIRTAQKVSVIQIIKIATQDGVSTSLIFFAIIAFAGILDKGYIWSLQKFWGAVFVALMPGVIVTLGGVYKIYTDVVFRDILIKKYKDKDESKNHKD
jgi:hypothetical protein